MKTTMRDLIRGSVWSAAALLLMAAPMTAQTNSDVDSIKALRARSNEAIAHHDVPAILSFVDDEFQVTAGGGAVVGSAEAMGDALTSQFAAFDDVIYVRTIDTVEISQSDPLAAELGTWVGTWTTPAGPLRTGGRYSAMWRKRESGWVIRSELFVTLFCEGSGCTGG
jgi:ketosteroid isomerase-like protein